MYVNHDDLQIIASESDSQGESILSAMDDEVVSLKCKVCVVILNYKIKFFVCFRIVIFNESDTV